MKKKNMIRVNTLLGILVIAAALFTFRLSWMAASTLIVVAGLLAAVYAFERRAVDTRTLALLGVVTATTVAARQLFHGFGGASPVFYFIILAGYVFGPRFGFMAGALTILVSNFSLGHGPWTPFQMTGLGLVGGVAGVLPRRKGWWERFALAFYGLVAGFFYGAATNVFYWLAFTAEQTWATFLGVSAASLPFDAMRGITSAGLLFFASAPAMRVMNRHKKRMRPSTGDECESDGQGPVLGEMRGGRPADDGYIS